MKKYYKVSLVLSDILIEGCLTPARAPMIIDNESIIVSRKEIYNIYEEILTGIKIPKILFCSTQNGDVDILKPPFPWNVWCFVAPEGLEDYLDFKDNSISFKWEEVSDLNEIMAYQKEHQDIKQWSDRLKYLFSHNNNNIFYKEKPLLTHKEQRVLKRK